MDSPNLDSLINLSRYPINDLDQTTGKELVARLRDELRDEGLCRLRGFLTSTAIAQLVEQAQAVEQHAYYGLTEASPYFNDYDPELPADHPRNIHTQRELGLVAADLNLDDCTHVHVVK